MRVRLAHASLQFSDTNAQHTEDVEKIFDRAVDRRYAWLTGTEAGPGAGNLSRELIRIGENHNYRLWVPEHQSKGPAGHTGCWIAVREDLIAGEWKRGYRHVIPGSEQLKEEDPRVDQRFGPRGLVHVNFSSTNDALGDVAIGSAHYLAGGRRPGTVYWEWNKKLAQEIGAWAEEQGKGSAIVFYGGDQNMVDSQNDEPQGDTFFGEDLTSTWDELEKWENTGHGNIDVIATYNKDKRVSALRTVVLDDSEFRLHGDHFFVEATLNVEPRKH